MTAAEQQLQMNSRLAEHIKARIERGESVSEQERTFLREQWPAEKPAILSKIARDDQNAAVARDAQKHATAASKRLNLIAKLPSSSMQTIATKRPKASKVKPSAILGIIPSLISVETGE